jgi:hypothetical protein
MPTTQFDVDGHDGLRDYWDGLTGMFRGVISSASWGALGAPKSGDSVMSLWGQSVGSAMEGHIGVQIMMHGGAKAGVGLAALIPTAGRSGGAVLEGGAEFLVGSILTGGAAKNAVAVLHAMANAHEQGRDAQGKFVSKKPGEAPPGSTAEKEALESVGATKNTQKLNGTIRDGTVTETGQHVEVKSGASVNDTQQLRDMGQAAVDTTGKPLKVVTTNPNVKVSKPARRNKNLEFEHKPQE